MTCLTSAHSDLDLRVSTTLCHSRVKGTENTWCLRSTSSGRKYNPVVNLPDNFLCVVSHVVVGIMDNECKKIQFNDPLNNYKIILCLFFTQLSISQVHSPIQVLHKA